MPVTSIVPPLVGVLATALIGVVVWAFKLDGKVKVQETEREALKELLLEKFCDIGRRLERIENILNHKDMFPLK